ncbi:Transposase IS200 like protein [Pseudobythopirellula maris]|uniref:Transposase IS200 like protein n=1 Tax=Pseudobythopirellula maris TaxID=2527991 RepID=A0A5C5ZS70_9BACT|nr:IS200/IS605 family transposase [Pseudobythopirellula maris]TWT90339.1 Transposase IS200 like protein [Pseudobythopirellula maris]
MPSSYTSLTYHIVFSTKYRRPLLVSEMRGRLYEYMGGIVRREYGTLLEIGGVEDHVHLLTRIHPSTAVADFLRVLKSNSSGWVNEQSLTPNRFAWQEGYSAFTVSESQTGAVRRYIQRQEAHHAKQDFRAEIERLCEHHGLTLDAEHFA